MGYKSSKCQKQKINEIKRTANKIKKFHLKLLCSAMLCFAITNEN